jgi:peptidyl-dipeptidase A
MKPILSLTALAVALLSHPVCAQTAAPTAADAEAFVDKAEEAMFAHSLTQGRADCINATYITDDTDALATEIGAKRTEMNVGFALEAAKYATVQGLSPELTRRLLLLRTQLTLPAPTTPGAAQELNRLSTGLQSAYGKGKGTLRGQPVNGSDIEAEMGTNRNPDELKEMWVSWHDSVGAPMRGDYAKLVSITNAGAKELGFADTGADRKSVV